MAYLIPADLSRPITEVHPADGFSFVYGEMHQLIGADTVEFQRLPRPIPGMPGTHFVCDGEGLLADHPVPNRRLAEYLPLPSKREVRADLKRRQVDAYVGLPLDGDQDQSAFFIAGDVLVVTIKRMGYEDERIY